MLIPLLFSFITLFATCCIEYGTLTMRRSIPTHITVRLIAYTLGTCLYYFLYRLGVKHYVFYYFISVIYLLVCVYLFAESLPQKIFLFFTDWCFTTFVSSLCNWATIFIDAGNLRYSVRAALYLAGFAVMLPLYFKYGRKYVREMLRLFEKSNPGYVALPFLSLVLFTVLFGPLTPVKTLSQFVTMALFITFIIFTYYLMIIHFHLLIARLQIENNLAGAEKQLVLQKKYYAEVEKGLRVQRERLHDTRHHLTAVARMASDGNTEALHQYLSTLLRQYEQGINARYCENEVANAVIGGYVGIAQENGIAVALELDLPQTIGMDEYELCTLFGNALDNAIEACQRVPEQSSLYPKRAIKLKSRVDQDRLTIRIENTFQNDPSVDKDSFASSKGAQGGVGLESVKTVIELYEGCLSCERKESSFIFSAVLCLRK